MMKLLSKIISTISSINFSFSFYVILFSSLLIIKVSSYVHMCWYVNWSEIRVNLPFSPDLIDYDLCSHLIYSAAVIDPHTYDILFMQKNIKNNMNKILASKKEHKDLKVILTIGSYDTKSFGFNAVTNPNDTDAMKLFSLKLVKFLRKHQFDGVLIDYEFPNLKTRGSEPYTKPGFSLLLKTIKEKFREETTLSKKAELLLMAAVAARIDWVEKFYETSEVISYDIKNTKNKKTFFTSPLFPALNETGPEATYNQVSAVAKWITEGAPTDKIVLGIPAYGRSFELADPSNYNSKDAPALGPALPGLVTDEPGVLSYFEICDKINTNASAKRWQSESLSPYLIYDEKYWVSYEDTNSITEKMLFIKANNLSGAFLWSIDLDDFNGEYCSQGKYPLLTAIKNELIGNEFEKTNVNSNLSELFSSSLPSSSSFFAQNLNLLIFSTCLSYFVLCK